MKLLRIFLPAVAAFLLLIVLFAWVNQTALANVSQPVDLRDFDSGQAAPPDMPQSSDVVSKFLPSGDNYIHGLIYYNGFLYASTRTDPARVLKINPNTLDVSTSVTLTSQIEGEDIIAANSYLWVIIYSEPARLIRVDPDTLDWTVALEFNTPVTATMGAGESLAYAFNYLWVGGRDHLARVDISNPISPTYQLYDLDSLNLSTSNVGLLGSLAHDNQFLWGTYKQHTGPLNAGSFYASTVVKMNPADPASVYTKTEISTDTPDDSAFTGGAYFVGGEGQPNQTTPSNIYQFSSDPAVYTTTQAAGSASFGLFVNPGEPQYIWGAYVDSPGTVKKFDLSSTPVFSLTLPSGFNDPSEIAFDGDGNVYITTWQAPAGIVKYSAQFLTSDLRISASDLPDPVYAGNDLTYTLTITNDGPLDASGVVITDSLPAQVSYLSSVPGSPDCSLSDGVLTCAIGSLEAHGSRQVVILAAVDGQASGTITDTAGVTSSTSDPDPQNNTAQVKTTVISPTSLEADLLIGVDSNPNPVEAGQSITYTLAITNSGPSDAAGVIVTNTLPAQVSFLSSSPGSPVCTHSGSSVACHLGQLNALASQKVIIVAVVDGQASGAITNIARVSSTSSDPDQQNNSAQVTTTVINPTSPQADLLIGVDSTPNPVEAGQPITFTLSITNNGPSDAAGVLITNTLPAQVSFLSSSPASPLCNHSGSLITCNFGQLNAHNSQQVTVMATVSDLASGVITDTMQTTSSTPDPNQQNNTANHQTTVINLTGFFYRLFLPVTR
jgi:uncharacterized repeat protein (TIGR01451 family)